MQDALLAPIYSAGFIDAPDGRRFDLNSVIDPGEGAFLRGIIADDPSVLKTLEVGCGLGFSAYYICTALNGREGAMHTIVDPKQSSVFQNLGLSLLASAGLKNFEMREEGSEFLLPRLAQSEPSSFDMIFIDGWHTFDHTMVDLFYANRLVRVGGYIVIDDCSLPSVAKAVNYFANYPCYEIHRQADEPSWRRAARRLAGRFPFARMVALRKTQDDNRTASWRSTV